MLPSPIMAMNSWLADGQECPTAPAPLSGRLWEARLETQMLPGQAGNMKV